MSKTKSLVTTTCSWPCLHSLLIAPTIIFWFTHICYSFFPTFPLYSQYAQVINSPLGFTLIIMCLPIVSLSLSMFHHLNHLDRPSRVTSINFVISFILTTIAMLLVSGT